MKKGDYLNTILRSNKTVFTLQDIVLLWQEEHTGAALVRLNYYVKKGDLYRIRKGVYVKNKKYDKLELATRIFKPAYVSFETVLAKEGLIFQFQTAITVASYLTRNISMDEQIYSYKKIKDTVLLNPIEVKQEDNISIASKERAFLDTLYSNTDYHFDNLRSLNWDIVFSILPLYNNMRLSKKVHQLNKL
jgi:predicted transcriptional regulator of viral defense system